MPLLEQLRKQEMMIKGKLKSKVSLLFALRTLLLSLELVVPLQGFIQVFPPHTHTHIPFPIERNIFESGLENFII